MASVPLQSLLEQANRALETGAADQAIGIAQHILQYVPELIEGHRLLGEAYLNANRPQEALAAFEEVLRADPENIAAYYGLGLGHQALEQRVEAIHSFERALEIQPNLAELRTQLTRLYAETPGSPGQFRLSRPGLGRLYARGQMYTQAIDEFRAVLDTEVERDDVRVAQAEALWRDGQEDEAADWSRDCLSHQPALHKPTLILAYIYLAGGQPEGQALWQRATRQDPKLQMAQTLFDVLPPVRVDEPQLPSFDLQAWTRQQEQQAAAAAPAPVAATNDDDFFDDSWLGGVSIDAEQAAQPPLTAAAPEPVAQPAAATDDDDLLASLLAFDEQPATTAQQNGATAEAPAVAVPVDDFGDVKPFSFDDWNFDEENAGTSPGRFHFEETSGGTLDHLGLDEAVPAPVPAVDHRREPATPAGMIDGVVQPLTFDELGTGVEPFTVDDGGGVQPFSFADFNFDAGSDEPASGTLAAEHRASSPEPKAFSLDELAPESIDEVEGQRLAGPSNAHDFESFEDEPEGGFSWQEPSWRNGQPATPPPPPAEEGSIFDKLMKRPKPELAEAAPAPVEAEPSESDFFSLDDVDLREGEPGHAAAAGVAVPSHGETARTVADTATPPASAPHEPDVAPVSPAEFGFGEPVAPAASAPHAPEVAPFSPVEFGFSEAELASFASTGPAHSSGHDLLPADLGIEAEPQPFSLADLGLTDDEIAELGLTGTDAQPTHASAIPEPAQPSHDPDPLSLADLGFNVDEHTAHPPTSAHAGPAEPKPPATPEAPTFEPEHALPSHEPDTSDALPFSLADLGLTEHEIDTFDLGASPLPSPAEIAHVDAALTADEHDIHAGLPSLTAAAGVNPLPAPAAEPAAVEQDATPAQLPAAATTPAQPPAAVATPAASSAPHAHPAPAEQPAPPAPPAPVSPPAAPARGARPDLQSYRTQLAADPENDTLRLAIARMSEQTGDLEQCMSHYKELIRRNALLDHVTDDLQELIAAHSEPAWLRRLHRLLGDAYLKQDRFREAMDEYSWTPSRAS